VCVQERSTISPLYTGPSRGQVRQLPLSAHLHATVWCGGLGVSVPAQLWDPTRLQRKPMYNESLRHRNVAMLPAERQQWKTGGGLSLQQRQAIPRLFRSTLFQQGLWRRGRLLLQLWSCGMQMSEYSLRVALLPGGSL